MYVHHWYYYYTFGAHFDVYELLTYWTTHYLQHTLLTTYITYNLNLHVVFYDNTYEIHPTVRTWTIF
jgi:hypothetical protein